VSDTESSARYELGPDGEPRYRPAFEQPDPPYGYAVVPIPPMAAAAQTSGLAIASLVLGILWIWWVGSALALVFGYVAKNQIEHSHGRLGGRGLAIAGIVLGYVGLGTFALFVILGASII
jgi:hypothetical protein